MNIGINNGDTEDIPWTSQLFKNATYFTHDTGGANPERIEVEVTGRYQVIANVPYATAAAGRAVIKMYLRVDNSTDLTRCSAYSYTRGSSYGGASCQVVTEVDLNANSYITVRTYCEDLDSTSNIMVDDAETEVIVRYLGS